MTPEIRKAIEEASWERISLSLAIYTRRKLRNKFWRGVQHGPIPGAKEIEDFVQDSIATFLESPDSWDPERKTLLEHLQGIISSRVSHAAERSENTFEVRSTTDWTEVNQFTVDTSKIEGPRSSRANAPLLIADERKQLLDMCEGNRDKDREIVRVVIDEELYTPREIAERLSIDVSMVNNAKKRLGRNSQYQRLLRLKHPPPSMTTEPTAGTPEPETRRRRA